MSLVSILDAQVLNLPSRIGAAMSALGQKQTIRLRGTMSASEP
jgi:hypothetical protein